MSLIVKGGFVYDPLNGVDGERMDIHIKDGRIVEEVPEREAKILDASGMVVMPGGVDLHSHIAGSKINLGRLLRPEDHRKDPVPRTPVTRAGVGYSCPTTYTAGYRYAQMGYTTVMEPAMPPLGARHVHEELNDTPILDKSAYPLFGNNYFVLKYVKEGDLEMLKGFVAWLMRATKGYAIKIVNPGGVESWKWGKNVEGLDDQVEGFEVTPRQIITSLARANEELGFPHTIHLHCNNLGIPGNYETTIETMRAVQDIKPRKGRETTIHVVHCQFNALAGDSWATLKSGAPEIAEYVNGHKHVTLDLGQVVFTDTTTMTGDGPWQFRLYNLTGNKWVNSDVEMEAGAGVVPYTFRKKNPVNAIQWAIGLELALLIYDPWRVYMTTDHPNGGPFTFYPKVISWLMSRKARTETMLEIHRAVMRRTTLADIYREYDFYEITITTRAAPAKALGLGEKGHLGPGADADVAVYDIDPTDWRPSMYRELERAFSRAKYTIKGGEVVVIDGEVVSSPQGETYWVDLEIPEEVEGELMKDLEEGFRNYYTISLNNYPVEDAYLPHQKRVQVEGCW
jgi:formylmethanofuran dehydrogenase subunit A